MHIPRQVHPRQRGAFPGRRRRKRGLRLFAACALRAAVVIFCLLLITLMACGCLYLREHWPRDGARGGAADGWEDAGSGGTGAPAGNVSAGAEAVEPEIPAGGTPGGAVVVLDAGHGGVQAGCAFNGVLEKDITLPITLLAAEKLESCGITVALTRDADTDVTLDERCEIANAAGAALFVSIDCNSYTEDSSVSGFEGYYRGSEEGKRLAESILSAAETLSVKTRNVKEADYQVLRETNMPAALMEIGFLSNAGERAQLQTAEYQETIAQAVADGIMDMLRG